MGYSFNMGSECYTPPLSYVKANFNVAICLTFAVVTTVVSDSNGAIISAITRRLRC